MSSSRRLAIGSVYVCAALAAVGPILAFADWALPVAVWLTLSLTWWLNESGRLPHLPDWFTKHLVAVPVLALTWVDIRYGESTLMSVISHLMCLLQIAKAIKRKTSSDLWTMFMVSLLQMIGGAVVALDVFYFALWGVYSAVGILFLNAIILQPAREDRSVGVFVPAGRTFLGRAARLSGLAPRA